MSSSADKAKPTNRLIHEKSPYLLQHAHNPVDWFPWGEAAFEKARAENKPVFISIGYSTCHWCHVMERESFENEDTAKLLNDGFVCVKVDREERPDVDQIYMNAVMLLAGQGGWPLNLFLTPDLKPFYGGTYFAPDGRYGRPGFPAVLQDVARMWKDRPEQVEKAGAQLAGFIAKGQTAPPTMGSLDESLLTQVGKTARASFDSQDGGFRSAPKFPPSMLLGLLLRLHAHTGEADLLAMVTTTLDKMAQGGIYDQIGGGFARYSTDDEWLVPHFEKMLYDNALLSRAYLEAYQVTGEAEYARVARETFTYLLRDMRSPEGGFYSAEDADSEGEEGKFYVWTPEEIEAVLGPEDGRIFSQLYDVTPQGNWEEGKSIPRLRADLPYSLEAVGKDGDWWKAAQAKMLRARAKRIRPHLDDKILTAWNSLLISSLAVGYQVLGEETYLKAAEKAADFLIKNLFENGRLLASYRAGPSHIQAYIDDYAFLQAALLDLYESTFDVSYLKKVLILESEMVRLFWDEKNGAFFFTGADQRDRARLLARPKEAYDGVIPSGNSTAALNYYRLSHLTGRKEFRGRADAILKCFSGALAQGGFNFPRMLQAFQFDFYGSAEIFVTGSRGESQEMLKAFWKHFLPGKVLAFAEESGLKHLAVLAPWVADRPALSGKPTAYICRDYACRLPVTDSREALKFLGVLI